MTTAVHRVKEPLTLESVGTYQWIAAVRAARIPPLTKCVALMLASYATGRSGENARPSQARLAQDVGIGTRALRNHLKALREDYCLIERVSFGSSTGKANQTDEYRLVIPSDLLERVDLAESPAPRTLAGRPLVSPPA